MSASLRYLTNKIPTLKASNKLTGVVARFQRAEVVAQSDPAILALAIMSVAFGDKKLALRKVS